MTELSLAWTSIVISIGASVMTWIIADTRAKSRLSFIEDKVRGLRKDIDIGSADDQSRIGVLEISLARSEQDRSEMHRAIDRIDESKASKDVVDGFRSEITTLRLDMDKRFDRLERILERPREE